jgi:hypothetical protein
MSNIEEEIEAKMEQAISHFHKSFKTNVYDKFLYHYTTIPTSLEYILSTHKLRFNSILHTNDPRETKDWNFTIELPKGINHEYVEQNYDLFNNIQIRANELVKHGIKLACFSLDNQAICEESNAYDFGRGYAKSRMWAQYAGNHTGLCLVFDKEQLVKDINDYLHEKGSIYSGRVFYRNLVSRESLSLNLNDILNEGLENVITNHLEKNIDAMYFIKGEDWRDEDEFRIAINTLSKEGFEYIDISNSLKGIVLGEAFPEVYKPALKYVLDRNFKDVFVSKLKWSNGHPLAFPDFLHY